MVMSYFQRTIPDWKIESFYTTGRQNKIDHFSVDGFSSDFNTVLEAMGCFYQFGPCQELRPSLTEEDIERCSRKRELDQLRLDYIQEKNFIVIEMWNVSAGDFTRQPLVLNYICERISLTDDHLEDTNS